MAKYTKNQKAVCPHCGTSVQFPTGGLAWLEQRVGGTTRLEWTQCPSCDEFIVTLERGALASTVPGVSEWKSTEEFVLWPLKSLRPAVPPDVPKHIKSDYEEAALVLALSAKASAALSRRCLQTVLVEAGGASSKLNLEQQIDCVQPALASAIANALDQVRLVGNFAAHTQKSINTGIVIDVEPGEAEWNLDVLDMLFDCYYVTPAEIQRRKGALNKKLQEAGKRTI